MAMQTYLIDAFTRYAASAVAANTVLRSLFGGLLPLSGLRLYNALGFGWGNSLLGFVGIVLIPIAGNHDGGHRFLSRPFVGLHRFRNLLECAVLPKPLILASTENIEPSDQC